VPTLADLHGAARERGIERYRTLSRRELSDLLEGPREAVRVERDGPLAVVVLDDPATRNALTAATLDALDAVLADIEADHGLRLVAVTGAGGVFCSGAGIREFDALPDGGTLLTDRGNAVLDRLAGLPVPTVALIGGHAVGGGVELALACDWRLAAPTAELRFVHASIGLTPGFGGLGRLAGLVGAGAALRLLATADVITGRRAVQIGVADELVPEGDQRAAARRLAERVAVTDRGAVAAAKAALAAGGREAERAAFLACWPNRQLPAATRA
jgi:enoyl-CoA hydratase/carnithine racemase